MPKLSAGLLLYKEPQAGEVQVFLVHPGGPLWKNKDSHAWSIPKGEYLEGEDAEKHAEREFSEELGIAVPTGPWVDLGSVRQSGGKLVRAWAIKVTDLVLETVRSNTFEMEWPPKSGRRMLFPEVDRAEWMTISEARGRIVTGQVGLLERLLEILSNPTA
jgi:predicted NUDIX family NTP pyrophosphohydrolase